MKPIGESPEIMAAYAEIDLAKMGIKKIVQAKSYDKEAAIAFLTTIIENKKIIEADYTEDIKSLEAIKSLNL